MLYTRAKRGGFDVAIQPARRTAPARCSLKTRATTVVSPDGRRAWLVYTRPEGLRAAPFDLERLQVAGPHAPILWPGWPTNLSGGAHFAVSAGGLLAYIPGGLDEINKTLLWVDKDGTSKEIGTIPGLGFVYRLSPDGRSLARPNATLGGIRDLVVDNLVERGTPRRLTDGTGANSPVWTPDGLRVIYSSLTDGNLVLAGRRQK